MTNFSFPLLLAGLLTAAAPAASPAEISGTYTGIIEDRGRVPFTLTLGKNQVAGDKVGTIRFRSLWACSLDVEYAGEARNAQHYTLLGPSTNNGRCVTLRRMQIREVDTALELVPESSDETLNKPVPLEPAKPRPN